MTAAFEKGSRVRVKHGFTYLKGSVCDPEPDARGRIHVAMDDGGIEPISPSRISLLSQCPPLGPVTRSGNPDGGRLRPVPKNVPVRDRSYLDWLRSMPCTVCGLEGSTEASHHGPHGIATKASDHDALPLCTSHHRRWHGKAASPHPAWDHLTRDQIRDRLAFYARQYRETYLLAYGGGELQSGEGILVGVLGGGLVDVLFPSPRTIEITTIAHALAGMNRWTSQSDPHISVAQHCVWVSERLPEEAALAGLLHDAAEAYLGDVSSPVKRHLAVYRDLEARVLAAIAVRFSVDFETYAHEIKAVDELAQGTEARDLMGDPAWAQHLPRDPDPIVPWDKATARTRFLQRFLELTERRAA